MADEADNPKPAPRDIPYVYGRLSRDRGTRGEMIHHVTTHKSTEGSMTTLERAARAIHRYDEPTVGWDDITAPRQRMYLNQVRAVLTAIREPSETLIPDEEVFAGFYHDADGVEDNNYITKDEARWAWQHMIDAALAEGE